MGWPHAFLGAGIKMNPHPCGLMGTQNCQVVIIVSYLSLKWFGVSVSMCMCLHAHVCEIRFMSIGGCNFVCPCVCVSRVPVPSA